MVIAVAVRQLVDLLGEAAEHGARQAQQTVGARPHGKALLRAVHERRLGRLRVLRSAKHTGAIWGDQC